MANVSKRISFKKPKFDLRSVVKNLDSDFRSFAKKSRPIVRKAIESNFIPFQYSRVKKESIPKIQTAIQKIGASPRIGFSRPVTILLNSAKTYAKYTNPPEIPALPEPVVSQLGRKTRIGRQSIKFINKLNLPPEAFGPLGMVGKKFGFKGIPIGRIATTMVTDSPELIRIRDKQQRGETLSRAERQRLIEEATYLVGGFTTGLETVSLKGPGKISLAKKLLGVSENATEQEIRQAYKNMIKNPKNYPRSLKDLASRNKQNAARMLNEARDILLENVQNIVKKDMQIIKQIGSKERLRNDLIRQGFEAEDAGNIVKANQIKNQIIEMDAATRRKKITLPAKQAVIQEQIVSPQIPPRQVKIKEIKLPRSLSGAKPRFGYGAKGLFSINFDSDVDKALFIVAQTNSSKSDAQYMEFLRTSLPGMSDTEIRELGREVKTSIKNRIANDIGIENHIVKFPSDAVPIPIPKEVIPPVAKTGQQSILDIAGVGKVTGAEAESAMERIRQQKSAKAVTPPGTPLDQAISRETIKGQMGEGLFTKPPETLNNLSDQVSAYENAIIKSGGDKIVEKLQEEAGKKGLSMRDHLNNLKKLAAGKKIDVIIPEALEVTEVMIDEISQKPFNKWSSDDKKIASEYIGVPVKQFNQLDEKQVGLLMETAGKSIMSEKQDPQALVTNLEQAVRDAFLANDEISAQNFLRARDNAVSELRNTGAEISAIPAEQLRGESKEYVDAVTREVESGLKFTGDVIGSHPEVLQYAPLIRKAVKIWQLNRNKAGFGDIDAITIRVPGLDEALGPIRRILGREPGMEDLASIKFPKGTFKRKVKVKKPRVGKAPVEPKPEIAPPPAPSLEYKQRKFFETITDSKISSPGLKKSVAEIDPKTYKVSKNIEAEKKAHNLVETNINTAIKKVESGEINDDITAIEVELIDKAQKDRRWNDVVRITNELATKLTDAGKFIQAVNIISKNKPVGMIRWAQDQYNKVNKRRHLFGFFSVKKAELTPELAEFITLRMEEIQKMPDGKVKSDATLDVLEAISKQIPWSWNELITSFRYQNMLSNPRTSLVNLYSGLFQTIIVRPSVLATESLIVDPVAASIQNRKRKSQYNDLPVYLKNALGSVPNAMEAFFTTMRGRTAIENPDYSADILRNMRIPKPLKGVQTFMEAGDKLFHAIIATGEYAVAKNRGMSDADAKALADKVAERSLFRQQIDPDNKTEQGKMLASIDGFTSVIQFARKKVPVLGHFVPFVKTMMNVAKQNLEFSPIIGSLSSIGAKNKTEQTSKALLGTIVMLFGAKLAMEGRTTWHVPTDEEEKTLFYAQNKRPYSIRIGNTWYSMLFFGPWALALGIPAAIKYNEETKGPMTDSEIEKATQVVSSMAKFYANQTYLIGLGQFLKMAEGDLDFNFMGNLGFTASQYIPFSGFLRYVATVVDRVYRKGRGFKDSIKKNLPFISKQLPAYTDPLGELSTRDTINFFLPYSIGKHEKKFDDLFDSRRLELQRKSVINKFKKELKEREELAQMGIDPSEQTIKTDFGEVVIPLYRKRTGMDNLEELETKKKPILIPELQEVEDYDSWFFQLKTIDKTINSLEKRIKDVTASPDLSTDIKRKYIDYNQQKLDQAKSFRSQLGLENQQFFDLYLGTEDGEKWLKSLYKELGLKVPKKKKVKVRKAPTIKLPKIPSVSAQAKLLRVPSTLRSKRFRVRPVSIPKTLTALPRIGGSVDAQPPLSVKLRPSPRLTIGSFRS